MTSIYEALTIQSVLTCHDSNKGFLKIWYLYILSTVQLLQVVNASLNLPIYWCVGTSFKETLCKYLLKLKPHSCACATSEKSQEIVIQSKEEAAENVSIIRGK